MEELGDRKPSQVLRRIQHLLGDKANSMDTTIMRVLFLQRLLSNIHMILTPSAAEKKKPDDGCCLIRSSSISSSIALNLVPWYDYSWSREQHPQRLDLFTILA